MKTYSLTLIQEGCNPTVTIISTEDSIPDLGSASKLLGGTFYALAREGTCYWRTVDNDKSARTYFYHNLDDNDYWLESEVREL